MENITYALYKTTFNSDGILKDDELIGNFNEFNNAVATAALIVHNTLSECIGYGEVKTDFYRYFVYEMNEDGDFDLTQPLYKTEMYVSI